MPNVSIIGQTIYSCMVVIVYRPTNHSFYENNFVFLIFFLPYHCLIKKK